MTILQNDVVCHEEKLLIYEMFWHYYRGEFHRLTPIQWKQLAQILRDLQSFVINHDISQALKILEDVNESDLETFEYDYNRLFVGPNGLLSSPFESSYRNLEGTIMQQDTLKVRNFYHHVGLQVENEGQVPDDHIVFELELILHLLNDQLLEHQQLYQMFLEQHLFKWIFEHCSRVMKNSQHPITYAMGVLLKEFLQLEKRDTEGGNSNDN
ncbi:TorD/DmsD family molecular chaperone [Niallia sp. Krafla_26]|uniref:TorD/DmsD family molecular chaperone n=1 Tax=Niallia sp. Krafla_26 TaxID=3064703 RepID=UPI003D180A16